MESKHTIVFVDAFTIRKAADGSDEILLITRKKIHNINIKSIVAQKQQKTK